jgi:hypothetical protein
MKSKTVLKLMVVDGRKQIPIDRDFLVTPALAFGLSTLEDNDDEGYGWGFAIGWGFWYFGFGVYTAMING